MGGGGGGLHEQSESVTFLALKTAAEGKHSRKVSGCRYPRVSLINYSPDVQNVWLPALSAKQSALSDKPSVGRRLGQGADFSILKRVFHS